MDSTPVVIFDFDGTLADSFDLAIDILAKLTRHRLAESEDISRLRGLDVLPLIRELGLPLWQAPLLAWRARRQFARQANQVQLIPGMADVVRELAKNHPLYVLSSNSATSVRTVLREQGIDSCFRQVYGSAKLLDKSRSLRRLLRSNHIASQSAWYIGDEARDIDAAHRVGLRIAAVAWGYNNVSALSRKHPDELVFAPEELLTILNKVYGDE